MKQRPRSPRKKLYLLHTWVGFHLALIMAVVLATGTIATVSHEIDWLLQEDMRVVPGTERVSWQTMTDAVEAYLPGCRISRIFAMESDSFAYRADVRNRDGQRVYVHINQWTGEVTGTSHPITVRRVFRDLHRYLFMPSIIGLPIVSSMAFVLAISLYTGFKTSRNWRTLMTRIRFNRGARVAVGDAHKAAGLWSSWFFVLIIVTGLWYLAEFGAAVAGSRFEPPRPGISEERLASFDRVIARPTTDNIILAAQNHFPELRINSIAYPFSPRGAITVLGSTGNPILRDRANRIFLDPFDLKPLHVQRSQDISLLAWLNETADPLHFGAFGGLTTKLIWFVFGLAMTGLSLSGVWLTWRRLNTRRISKTQLATAPLVLFTGIACMFWYERFQGPTPPLLEQQLSPQKVGTINVTPRLALKPDDRPAGLLRLIINTDVGLINMREVSMQIMQPDDMLGEKKTQQITRLAGTIATRANFPPTALEQGGRLRVTLRFNNGQTQTLHWPLPLEAG